MIRRPPMEDNWVRDFPNPGIPHSIRRRRLARRAIWVALVLAAAAGAWFGAPYVGMAVVAILGGSHG